MRYLGKFFKALAYLLVCSFVLLVSSILASSFYASLITPDKIVKKPERPSSVRKIEQAYQASKKQAKEEGQAVRVSIPSVPQARITRDTATGTCFVPAGQHTDCNGERTASFVTVQHGTTECSIMANGPGVISTNCEY